MKKIVFAFLIFAISASAYAQTKGASVNVALDNIEKTTASIVETEHIKMSAKERAQVYTDRMASRLKLDEAQKKQIFLVNLDTAEKMEEIRGIKTLDESLYQRKQQSLVIDSNSKIERVLNKTQVEAYRAHISNAQQAQREKLNAIKAASISKK